MQPYKPIDKNLSVPEREERILEFWKKNDIFGKSLKQNEGGPGFIFYEGPPTANGLPGCHHVLARAFKDLFPRYKSMLGYYVGRKAGWDTHGLPVELEVERELKISGKPEIEEYGIDRFNRKCKESVLRYEAAWRRMTERIGFWLDMDDPYVTFTNDYIESVWSILKKIWEDDLLYRDYKVVAYCPRCGTSLSSHEVSLGYEEVDDPSVYIKFHVRDNLYLLAWTTTPWTLAGNAALAIDPDVIYARVAVDGDELILARDLVEEVIGPGTEVLEEMPGKDLVGWKYEPLYSFIEPDSPAHYVVGADFVVLTQGTGIIHIAPAYGEDDMALGREHNLPMLHPVKLDGCYGEEMGPWSGMFVKEADPLIVQDLEDRGLLFRRETYHHNYPFCWRCHSPLLYYAKTCWFIKMTQRRQELIEANQKVAWYPDHIKTGRFGDWLDNLSDWALSRERYWGTPLPIWTCEGCDRDMAVGSIAELKERGRKVPEDIELHKPFIDEVELKCDKCGRTMRRTPEVVDAWFDSGSMPFAQWHYPIENEEKFEANFPADFICEAIDQTRGWFYTLMAIGTLMRGESSYKNVLCLGHILDKDGKKMSKHLGNVIDPQEILDKQGADAFRWYFYAVGSPWTPRRFYPEVVEEVNRKILDTLRNSVSFFILYANVDGMNGAEASREAGRDRPIMDRWLLSRLNSTADEVRRALDRYDVIRATRVLEGFVDDLSNWYIRRSRRRFWAPGRERDKLAAYASLWDALEALCRLLAPFTPFIAEEIYQTLVRGSGSDRPESVHLCAYPEPEAELVDKDLEASGAVVRDVVNLGRAARNQAGIKVRQPLSLALVKLPDGERPIYWSDLRPQILEELNVKEVRIASAEATYSELQLKPNYSRLGPRFGSKLSGVKKRLGSMDRQDIDSARQDGVLRIEIEGETVEFDEEEVRIETTARPGWSLASDKDKTVALSTELTTELKNEGFAREVVNKIQNMRKLADFNVLDRIIVYINTTDRVVEAIEDFKDYISTETLADSIEYSPEGEKVGFKDWDINGQRARLAVVRAEASK